MSHQMLNGTWEEILAHSAELSGKHVVVIVTDAPQQAAQVFNNMGNGSFLEMLPQLKAMAQAVRNGEFQMPEGFQGAGFQGQQPAAAYSTQPETEYPTQPPAPVHSVQEPQPSFPYAPTAGGFPGVAQQNEQPLPNEPELHTKSDDLPEW